MSTGFPLELINVPSPLLRTSLSLKCTCEPLSRSPNPNHKSANACAATEAVLCHSRGLLLFNLRGTPSSDYIKRKDPSDPESGSLGIFSLNMIGACRPH